MLVRSVHGPTARIKYDDIDYGRRPGRRYYLHIADQQMPVATRLYEFADIRRMEAAGRDVDLEVARDLCGLEAFSVHRDEA